MTRQIGNTFQEFLTDYSVNEWGRKAQVINNQLSVIEDSVTALKDATATENNSEVDALLKRSLQTLEQALQSSNQQEQITLASQAVSWLLQTPAFTAINNSEIEKLRKKIGYSYGQLAKISENEKVARDAVQLLQNSAW